MNSEDEHWQYAFACADWKLKEWAEEFSFVRDSKQHAYSGCDPNRIISLTKAFLAEPLAKKFGGHQSSLQSTLDLATNHILPAFNRGREAGHECWSAGNRLDTPALKDQASSSSEGDAYPDWYMEGFCVAYAEAELESHRGT